jgi:iron-sulfur cluster repair protein YtfE (RIC family)
VNAIRFLKQQHEEAKQAFQRIEQASPEQRGELWKHLSPELKLHERMEEEHVYGPAAAEAKADDTLADWPDEHHEQVQEAEQLIVRIDQAPARDSQWLQQVQKLKSALEEHIQVEERDIWPRIESTWDAARLEQAGARMEAMKREASAAAGSARR